VTQAKATVSAARGGHGSLRLALALLFGLALAVAQSALAQARPAPDGFADLVERVSPAVVNITTSAVVASADRQMPMVANSSSASSGAMRWARAS